METRSVTSTPTSETVLPSGIKMPVLVDGVPSLIGFSENGTELGKLDLMLWQYTQGLTTNVQAAQKNGGLLNDPIAISALNSITADIPQIAAAKAAASQLSSAINNTFGVGSVVGRVTTALFSGDPIGALKAAFSGRTWRYDQYQLATWYSYHVLGRDIGDTTHASDQLVIEACKWFIDRTGVFINGARLFAAFINPMDNDNHFTNRPGSPTEYMILVNNNPFVTIDPQRVNAAYQVFRTYFSDLTHPGPLGNWRNTIGVYDRELVQLAQQGYNNYYGNLAALKQASASGQTDFLNTVENTGSSNITIYITIAIVIIIFIILIAK